MQGYIIHINPSRDEDLIVRVLTKKNIFTSYRFYGARHSSINLGYKIDAELIHSSKSNIPQLRNVLHLGFKWNSMRERMLLWQSFIALFHKHFSGVEEVDSFYFELLDSIANRLEKQNPKRLALEGYVKLLEFEGRLHVKKKCFLCEQTINNDFALARGFLPAHAKCIASSPIDQKSIDELLLHKTTILLEDEEIAELWKILQEGL